MSFQPQWISVLIIFPDMYLSFKRKQTQQLNCIHFRGHLIFKACACHICCPTSYQFDICGINNVILNTCLSVLSVQFSVSLDCCLLTKLLFKSQYSKHRYHASVDQAIIKTTATNKVFCRYSRYKTINLFLRTESPKREKS